MTDRDRQRLVGVHPVLAKAVEAALDAMAAMGHPMFVVEGVRSLERQIALYAQGRTRPGPIVTHCDGVRNPSNHQAKADGFGYAVDCAFVDDPSTAAAETWDVDQPWRVYGEICKWFGCVWGGDWPSRKIDRPHVELPLGVEERRA
jgi:peptidoglycan L-alanyl-D-glutamate endopeptidase CwlK